MNQTRFSGLLMISIAIFFAGCGEESEPTSPGMTESPLLQKGITYWDSIGSATINGSQVPTHVVAIMGDDSTLYFVVSRRSLPLYHFQNDWDRYRIVAKRTNTSEWKFNIDTARSVVDNKYRFINGYINVSGRSNDSARTFTIGLRSYQDSSRAYSTGFSTGRAIKSNNAVFEMGF